MSNLPLNSVENTRDNVTQSIDGNSNLTKSPYKLSMTEKRVIGGLQKLTDMLFKQYYKDNNQTEYGDGNSNSNSNGNNVDENVQSDEVTTSREIAASNTTEMRTNKENDGNIQHFLDNDMQNGAEQFCAMVVHQLTDGNMVEQADEWHLGQLDAYNKAHQRFFG